jgi:hypothetical protein
VIILQSKADLPQVRWKFPVDDRGNERRPQGQQDQQRAEAVMHHPILPPTKQRRQFLTEGRSQIVSLFAIDEIGETAGHARREAASEYSRGLLARGNCDVCRVH